MQNDKEERRRAFEQLAERRGYDITRNGAIYQNILTNDAFYLFEAGLQQVSPVREAGPWSAGISDGKAFVQSDDFSHDVRLMVNGEFASPELRLAYAEELARRLNRAGEGVIQPED
ncbi:hypothetical protein D3C71_24240 [compost metagenome]